MSDNPVKKTTKATAPEEGAKRRGAPVLPPEEKRTSQYVLHMTAEEKSAHAAFAKAKKLKLADFYRNAAAEYMKRHK